nr:hypothetical protein [Tanacetum cinerariifolium]
MECANGITRRPRLPPNDIQALSGCWKGLVPIRIWCWRYPWLGKPFRMLRDSLADICLDLVPVVDLLALLVAGSDGVIAYSGSPPSLRLFDPRRQPEPYTGSVVRQIAE